MSRTWILQANPKHYDIDAALRTLDRIWWRVPQYTAQVEPGDVAVIWRSGRAAGIVGVGRIVSAPQLREAPPEEDPFILSREEARRDDTQVLVLLRPAPFVAKEQVAALPDFAGHPIVTGPMGTVFSVSDVAWGALRVLVPEPPDSVDEPSEPLPASFAWAQRSTVVRSIAGEAGGDELAALARVCALVDEERPRSGDLAVRLERVLGVAPTSARLAVSFLQSVGFLSLAEGVYRLGRWTERWRQTGDHRLVVALIHSRCRFVGELLAAAQEQKSPEELLAIANTTYRLGWDTQAQVTSRCGWLESAGMLERTENGTVVTSAAGRALLAELTRSGPAGPGAPSVTPVTDPAAVAAPSVPAGTPSTLEPAGPEPPEEVDQVMAALEASATDSANPNRFEQAVRDAFAFLGFRSEWLGGPGRTDVLLDATLGAGYSYRVAVDCKTSASGSVGDQQVDWVTLQEHRNKHDANYLAIVAPSPRGARLLDRARERDIAVISASQLVGICRQHANAPVGLDAYRSLFTSGGELDAHELDDAAENVVRLTRLAVAACEALRLRAATFGRLSARDLLLILAENGAAEGTTEAELQQILATLSSPLLGVLEGSGSSGYLLVMNPDVTRRRLEMLAARLGASEA